VETDARQVKQWWGDLTDDDLDHIDGSTDKLIGRLQERYGYAKEDAAKEVDRRQFLRHRGQDL